MFSSLQMFFNFAEFVPFLDVHSLKLVPIFLPVLFFYEGHTCTLDRVKILEKEEDWFKRKVKEAIQIHRQRPSLKPGPVLPLGRLGGRLGRKAKGGVKMTKKGVQN